MSKITSSLKYGSFIYDFATDGGSVGTIAMGKFIPPNCMVWFGYAKVITTLTSAGAALVSVGFVGPTNDLIFNTSISSLTAGAIIPGVDLLTNGIPITSESQLSFTIVDFDLTAGKLVYFYAYTEWGAGTSFPVNTGIGYMVIGSTFTIG